MNQCQLAYFGVWTPFLFDLSTGRLRKLIEVPLPSTYFASLQSVFLQFLLGRPGVV